jgi:flagella basal body P-ring formation protein FlgA
MKSGAFAGFAGGGPAYSYRMYKLNPSFRARCAAALVAPLLTLWVVPVSAQIASAQSAPDYPALALEWARAAAPAAMPASRTPLQIEVSVGALDSRLKLAACGNVEPYLPVGSRLWGKTRVGLRCVDGMSRWNVSIPATVKVLGPAWVVKTPVASGSVISADDAVEAQVDWAQERDPVLTFPSTWVGQIATRQLNTGQTLRQGMVKAAQAFQAGAQVRVLAQGVGFQVSADAQALSAGVVGQPARIRMENGRITSGLVLDARTVKIDL